MAALSLFAICGGLYSMNVWLRPVIPASASNGNISSNKPTTEQQPPSDTVLPFPRAPKKVPKISPAKIRITSTKKEESKTPASELQAAPPTEIAKLVPNAPAVINVEPGGSFDGTCDTIISGNRTAINAGGKVVTHREGFNAPSPCSPSELKIATIDFLLASSLSDSNNENAWSVFSISVLRDDFDEQVIKDFTAQPNMEKKREFLKKLKESIKP